MLEVVDGAGIAATHELEVDVAVVGSGPAGSAVARRVAAAGLSVAVLEEGPHIQPQDFSEPSFDAMAQLYRGMGATLLSGRAPTPYIQGCCVGGTSVINGAISWRLPKDVYDAWVEADPGLAEGLAWEDIQRAQQEIIDVLGIAPTDPAIAGQNNTLMARGAEAMGLEHRPISRNVASCRGSGRCMQGCPHGAKMSMDRSLLLEANRAGARVLSSVRVDRIAVENNRAVGCLGVATGGGRVMVRAGYAVVAAASAVQTPALLMRSGVRDGPVGRFFQCHPGISVAGRFPDVVAVWTGATQGHEVTGLRSEGLKFEALGYDMTLVAARLKGIGHSLSRDIGSLARWANWGVAVRSQARGRVKAKRGGGVKVAFGVSREDVMRARRGVAVLGEMMLAAGAEVVTPGVHGWHAEVSDRKTMAAFAEEGPLDPRAYTAAVTHMFGTCRMGTDPSHSVVAPSFEHRAVEALYVADSSVFPSNTGVNPQTSILALATLCGERVVAAAR